MDGSTNTAALTGEIQQLGSRGNTDTVRRVTDWIMRRPEQLTDTERKCHDELCERSRLCCVIRSGGESVAESFEPAAAAGAVEGAGRPVGVESDDVECGGGEGVLEADFR